MTDVAGTRGASASNPTNEQDLKKATMALEQKRLEIETQKLDLERSKAKWTAISVVVPLLAATATVAYGFWSTQKQSELNFQLEAAKSIMLAVDFETSGDRCRSALIVIAGLDTASRVYAACGA